VIVTHNLAQAHRISDQVAFFLMGKLVEVGETRTVFEAPQFEETANYIQGRFG
jgi:phosphate transport system ATP-binding protein